MKTVLFVCVENSDRSQMAEAVVRMHGGGRVEAMRDLIQKKVLELLDSLNGSC